MKATVFLAYYDGVDKPCWQYSCQVVYYNVVQCKKVSKLETKPTGCGVKAEVCVVYSLYLKMAEIEPRVVASSLFNAEVF